MGKRMRETVIIQSSKGFFCIIKAYWVWEKYHSYDENKAKKSVNMANGQLLNKSLQKAYKLRKQTITNWSSMVFSYN